MASSRWRDGFVLPRIDFSHMEIALTERSIGTAGRLGQTGGISRYMTVLSLFSASAAMIL
jgi:hypothetical protein